MTPGLPAPVDSSILGAQVRDEGTHFALWAPRATRVELALVDADRTQHNRDMHRSDDGVWSVFCPGVGPEQRYGYRVHGDWDPESGARFNPAKLLTDPYARAITGGVDYSGPILDHTAESDYLPDPEDSFEAVPLSVVVAPSPPPTPIARRRPLVESVIYETHLKAFTRLHPAVPEHLRGTYAGMAYPAVIEHLQRIGVTAVEFLPLQHFASEPFVVGRGLSNFWGYNTLGYFAPHSAYGSVGTLGQQVTEFKEMVSALHEADIEVILDVVYNHTAEGGHEGPTLSWRGIDHAGYYRLTDDLRNDYDVTGCGNSVDSSEPGVLNMIMDSLRYWVTEMGVDGFRFDLATTLIRDERHHVDQNHAFKQMLSEDPVFNDIKLIAEPWDMGPYGYQVGAFGKDWSEWNDRYRGFMRDYWRGAVGGVSELATRLSGSGDVFHHSERQIESSINFITAHDGFTLRDLVSYDVKHNHANGEDNRDGSDDNRSWNCGYEGETTDPAINALRRRQVKNMMATLILSHGVPMILAGDEMGRTQDGNNNAYCQDGPISWVNWDTMDEWSDLTDLTAQLTKLRADHPVLRPERWHSGNVITLPDGTETGRKSLAWFNSHGEMHDGAWHDGALKTIGMYASNRDEAFLIWFHAGDYEQTVQLPPDPWACDYTLVAHTGGPDELQGVDWSPGAEVVIPGRTVIVLQAGLPPWRTPEWADAPADHSSDRIAHAGADEA
ncbi:glycogen debranching protein GlgX [Enemella sp. A6]|uniref:glycogen debranching protein GlgX n=1 Tax=Enemella sp. A6 TaxID=3440152 RepID=UPI003EBE9657